MAGGVDTDAQIAVGAIAAIITAVVSAFAGYRLRNGRVDSSDAAQLWRESADLRRELSSQIAALRLEIHQRDERIAQLERERSRLQDQVHSLQIEVERLRLIEQGLAT
jgi:septal ring factor EnvC (AmiA/AmiB activator)